MHPTAQLDHTLVRGLAVIGPARAYRTPKVGPYTSIGANVTVDGSQVEHSIILAGAEFGNIGPRVETSVIGRGARIRRSFSLPSAMRLAVGDSAEVTLSCDRAPPARVRARRGGDGRHLTSEPD